MKKYKINKNKIKRNIKILINGIIATGLLFGIIATMQILTNAIFNIILK